MNFHNILVTTKRTMSDNAPALLTAVGVVGTLSTAFLAGKASYRAAEVIRIEIEEISLEKTGEPDNIFELTSKEKFELTYKLYIPATGCALLTVGAILGANRVGTRRAAAMAAAYSLSEKAYSEYKEKVIETIGKNKEQAVRDEIAKDRVERDSKKSTELVIVGDGDVLCHDAYSGRFFKSNMEALRRAENNVNRQILHDNYATISNFYNNIGLEHTSVSDEMGWNTDKFLELLFSSIVPDEGPYQGQPALSFDFGTVPIRDPWRFC